VFWATLKEEEEESSLLGSNLTVLEMRPTAPKLKLTQDLRKVFKVGCAYGEKKRHKKKS